MFCKKLKKNIHLEPLTVASWPLKFLQECIPGIHSYEILCSHLVQEAVARHSDITHAFPESERKVLYLFLLTL